MSTRVTEKDPNAIRRARQVLIEEMRAILSKVEARADKNFLPEEESRYNVLKEQVEQKDKEIKAALRQQELDNAETYPCASSGNDEYSDYVPDKKLGKRSFRSMFPKINRDNSFEKPEEFFEILASGRFDERMQSRSAMAGVGALGGFAVPTSTAELLWDRSLESSIVRPRAQVWPMSTLERKVPAFDSEDLSSSVYGFVGQWLGELQEANVQDPVVRSLTLKAKKLAIFSAMSREIAMGGLSFGSQLEIAMRKALGHFQDTAYISGSGVGEPLGVLNANCTIPVDRTGSGNVDFTDITKMYARLLPGSYTNAVWLVNQTALPKLILMSDAAGHLIWKPGEPLLGIPVIVTEKVPSLGTKGDVTLADFSCYSIGSFADIIVDVTNAFKWQEDRMDIRTIIMVDGQPIFSKPIKNSQGDTVSPFVVLK